MKTGPSTRAFRRTGRLVVATLMIATGGGLSLAGGALADSSGGPNDAGSRGHYRAQCRRLTKQIGHYEETVLPMAIERGNRAWEKATNEQIERLWHRRADLCPEYGAERSLLKKAADRTRQFNKMMAAAGRAALAFFTGGATGL